MGGGRDACEEAEMKMVRVYTGADGEAHLEERVLDFTEGDGLRTSLEQATGVMFAQRNAGTFADFHTAPRFQYVFYLTCAVEIDCGNGERVTLDSGDVLQEEDTSGRGHTTRVLKDGMCAFVRRED